MTEGIHFSWLILYLVSSPAALVIWPGLSRLTFPLGSAATNSQPPSQPDNAGHEPHHPPLLEAPWGRAQLIMEPPRKGLGLDAKASRRRFNICCPLALCRPHRRWSMTVWALESEGRMDLRCAICTVSPSVLRGPAALWAPGQHRTPALQRRGPAACETGPRLPPLATEHERGHVRGQGWEHELGASPCGRLKQRLRVGGGGSSLLRAGSRLWSAGAEGGRGGGKRWQAVGDAWLGTMCRSARSGCYAPSRQVPPCPRPELCFCGS